MAFRASSPRRGVIAVIAATLVVAMMWLPRAGAAPPRRPALKIGVSLALAGPDARWGVPMLRGVELAVEDVNRAGGVGGHTLETVVLDSAGPGLEGISRWRGMNNYERLIADPAVVAVVGPQTSGEGRAVAVLLSRAELATITPSATTFDITDPAERDHFRPGGRAVYGWKLLTFDASRGRDNSKMPFSALNALPRKFAALLAPGSLRHRLETVEFGRYATVGGAVLLGWLIFRWARALYGPGGGLLALTLFAFEPNILAHAGLVTTDLYAAWMTALAVWSFWRLLNHAGPGMWRVATAGAVLFALAQLAKYTCAYLVPILALIAVGHAAPELWALVREGRLRAAGARCLAASKFAALYVAAFLVVVNAGYWGQGTLKPLRDYWFASRQFRAVQVGMGPLASVGVPVPEPYLQGLDRVLADEREGANVYLLGQFGKDGVPGRRFPEYFAVAWLYKEPIATQVLLLLALATYAFRFRRFDFRRNEWPLVCAIGFFAWYFTFVYNFQVGFRHVLVVHPLLFVLAGSLLRDPSEIYRGARIVLGGLLVWLGISAGSYYPHFLAYFNEFVWDRTRSSQILVDSNLDWGQSERYVARYLRAHPEVYLRPDRPQPGTLLVSVNNYVGLFGNEQFRWLRENFEPVGHVAYTHLLFRVTPEAYQRMTDPLPPDYGDKVN